MLQKLVNQRVVAEIEVEENEFVSVEGTVYSVNVNDYYFHEKGEPIYINVALKPTEELPDTLDMEDLHEVPLANIRKA